MHICRGSIGPVLASAIPQTSLSRVDCSPKCLLLLLMTGVIKERHISRVCKFLVGNMAFFFIPPCVGLMDHAATLGRCLLPFLVIVILTTPLIYAVTAWTIQLTARLMDAKEARHD